jgi:tetratricopeptide (TPR) repeat protein
MGADDTNILLKRYMQFYKGLSYLGMREPDKAIALFDSLQGVPPLRDRADWYLAMAWLMKKDFQKAGEITQKIAQTDSPFRLPAAQLLKESPFQP